MSSPLSRKQKRARFVAEYLVDGNATRAAQAAGYSKKTAYSAGGRLLKDVEIKQLLVEKNAAINKKLEVSVERVRDELARLAFFDPRKFFKEDGSLVPITELDSDTAMCLAGMEVNELYEGRGEDRELIGYAKKFKLADKGQNLERLGRYLKMFTDRVEVVPDADSTERLASLLTRAAGRASQASSPR